MKSIRESIRRLLREEMLNTSKFFRRRISLDEIESMFPIISTQVYYNTKNYNQFKYKLTLFTVETIMWDKYGLIGYEDLPEQETIEFVTYVSELLEERINIIYNQTITALQK